MLRLLRLSARNARLSSPFSDRPHDRRVWSPASGFSTLMTSAPRSARIIVQNGPAMTCVRSSTVMPVRASPAWLSLPVHRAIHRCHRLIPPHWLPGSREGAGPPVRPGPAPIGAVVVATRPRPSAELRLSMNDLAVDFTSAPFRLICW